jgi:hypothetical protein
MFNNEAKLVAKLIVQARLRFVGRKEGGRWLIRRRRRARTAARSEAKEKGHI